MITLITLQAVIAVSVDMLPLPGGMGISETLFLIIFAPVFGELLLPGMVLSRGLGYYSELLISRCLRWWRWSCLDIGSRAARRMRQRQICLRMKKSARRLAEHNVRANITELHY